MLREVIRYVLMQLDISINRYSKIQRLNENLVRYNSNFRDLEFLRSLQDQNVLGALRNLDKSKSQFRQDLFVLAELNNKRNGFFVEFGATNGLDWSNTYLLEKEYGWTGILAEPAKIWHAELLKNRSANIEPSCVWDRSNEEIEFVETADSILSTAERFIYSDTHASARQKYRERYIVKSISLEDLLHKYGAPKVIDYLSIDTEGSEFDILKKFNFDRYTFSVITCEHNFTSNREKVRVLLENNGYERRLEHVSCVDDWYVKKT
jgi:FkbM family methyltransferase